MEETIVIDTKLVNLENGRFVLKEIINDMNERGYNAYKQITEYILTGEIGYITSYKGARNKIEKLDRRDLVETLLKEFTKWEY